MYFQRFYDTDLAQASYLLGCQRTGECLVIDPVRDVAPYLAGASAQKLRITHVTETHIHADYLSGSRELAQATGAKVYLSDEGDADWKYGFGDIKVYDGSTLTVGNLKIEVRHTPGHTPESISFLVTDTPRGDQPSMFFTGDFVFVGEIGRPDLLDEAAGGVDTRYEGARQMFASLRDGFLTLPDFVQVWPAHGAGSACGKALGAVPSTTVGYERALAWWAKYVQNGDEQGFTDELLGAQPDAPLYYGRMKAQNRAGPALLGEREPLNMLDAAEVLALPGTRLIDTRASAEHQAAAPEHSVNLPDSNALETWAGWLLEPQRDYVLICPADRAEAIRRRLWMVGVDRVVGFIDGVDGLNTREARPFPATELPQHGGALILDIRNKTEHREGAVPGSMQLHAGRLPWTLGELPRDREIVVHCQSGARSAAAASLLRAEGFTVSELAGGYGAWAQLQQAQQSAQPA